ncbi:MAG: hypothetical protein IPL26_17825 [Leptospiraceae bacterium]|nr:hypothetical protein [Leptospiraceae bacterium]
MKSFLSRRNTKTLNKLKLQKRICEDYVARRTFETEYLSLFLRGSVANLITVQLTMFTIIKNSKDEQ